jgi:hypothetical protein
MRNALLTFFYIEILPPFLDSMIGNPECKSAETGIRDEIIQVPHHGYIVRVGTHT